MTLDQLIKDRRPRKGLTGDWPLTQLRGMRRAPWLVHKNFHTEARVRGYLTGALFVRRSVRGHKYKLMLVAKCPFKKRALRYYPISLSAQEAEQLMTRRR